MLRPLVSLAVLAALAPQAEAAPPAGTQRYSFNACASGMAYQVQRQNTSVTSVSYNFDVGKNLIIEFNAETIRPSIEPLAAGDVNNFTVKLPYAETNVLAPLLNGHFKLYLELTFHPNGGGLVLDNFSVRDTGAPC